MTNLVRLVLIVPPILLSFLLNAQLQGKIELLPDEFTYQVSVVPTINWSAPTSITNSAQITLRAPAGTLDLQNFQSLTGIWDIIASINSPDEANEYDYFSFALNAPISNVDYVDSQPVILFSFDNSGDCSAVEIVDNITDPFMPPNSMSINVGNAFTVLAAGPGQNAYEGNSSEFQVECAIYVPVSIDAFSLENPVPCNGDETSLSIQINNGEEPYQISWEHLESGNSGIEPIADFGGILTLNNKIAGNYILEVIDDNNFSFQINYEITEPESIDFQLESIAASCNGSMDGVVSVLNISGGTTIADYSYDWHGFTVNSAILNNVNPGFQALTVSDDNGCEATDSISVDSELIIIPNPEILDVSCFGEADGAINLYPVVGNEPFTVDWSGNGITGNQSSAWNLSGGTYYFTLTDGTGVCNVSDSVEVFEPMAIDFDLTAGTPEPCAINSEVTITLENVINADFPILSSIDGLNFFPENYFEISVGESYEITLQDANGCEAKKDIFIEESDHIQILLEDFVTIKLGESYKMETIFTPENLNFEWFPSTTLSCTDCPSPIASPLETTTYYVKATNQFGCVEESKITIIVQKDRNVYIPNAFSPNGDGENDHLTIFAGSGVEQINSLQIFNRWGSLVYQSPNNFSANDPEMGWDGKFNGIMMKEGVYLYQAFVSFSDGEIINFSGEVNLVK